MQLKFQKLESDPKKGHIIQFSLEFVHTVSQRHFIAIKRPLMDVEIIERNVRSTYCEQIEKGLFSDIFQQECEKEIKNAIHTEKIRILKLPRPIIFDGVVTEAKYVDGGATIKMRVSLPDAFYILENMKNMDEMEAELLEFPSYLSGDMQKEKIIDNVQKFLNENPFSTVNHDEKRYPFKFKERKDEVLEKPREEERAIPKVSLHDVPLDD